MRGTQGALIIASTIQIILGFSGLWRNVLKLLSPLSAVPLVSLVGFGLYELGFPGVSLLYLFLSLHVSTSGLTKYSACR
jgi:xanthine/uracil permease